MQVSRKGGKSRRAAKIRMPERASDSAGRSTGAIERFIERTLGARLEELASEIRGLRGNMRQFDKTHEQELHLAAQ